MTSLMRYLFLFLSFFQFNNKLLLLSVIILKYIISKNTHTDLV